MTPAPLQTGQAPSELELNSAGFTPLAFANALRIGSSRPVYVRIGRGWQYDRMERLPWAGRVGGRGWVRTCDFPLVSSQAACSVPTRETAGRARPQVQQLQCH